MDFEKWKADLERRAPKDRNREPVSAEPLLERKKGTCRWCYGVFYLDDRTTCPIKSERTCLGLGEDEPAKIEVVHQCRYCGGWFTEDKRPDCMGFTGPCLGIREQSP